MSGGPQLRPDPDRTGAALRLAVALACLAFVFAVGIYAVILELRSLAPR